MEIVIIDKKVDREYLIKEYYTILDGTLLGKGFLKRNELYYRIYGDGFLQTVYPYSGPKGIEVRLYIDCIPLYQWMDVLNSKKITLDDLAYYDFAKIIRKPEFDFYEQISYFKENCDPIFDGFKTPKDYIALKEKWVYPASETEEDLKEEEVIREIMKEHFPDISEKAEPVFYDKGCLYAAIKAGRFDDSIKDINYSFYSNLCYNIYDYRNGSINKTVFESNEKWERAIFEQELELKRMMECCDTKGIEAVLQDNMDYNLRILRNKMHLKISDK